jgi:predicted RecA/RadA family phage recombinase
MPLGYRGEGITFSAPMAAESTIAKGDVVAFDAQAQLVRAPAHEKSPVGVAVEGRTTGPGQHPHLAFVKHGVAGVKAAAPVRAGEAVRVGANPGEVAPLPDQAVDEGGAAAYTLHRNEKLGVALADIAAGAEGDVFVGG